MNIFKRPLSWEGKTALYVVLLVSLTMLPFLGWIVGTIITHEAVPFEVTSPKGSPLVAVNFTIDNTTYVNSVVIFGGSPELTFLSSETEPDNVEIRLLTPGWCIDVWKWMGKDRKWALSEKCTTELSINYYGFTHRYIREAGVASWRLERGYILVFYKKDGNVTNYEEVRFEAEYRGHRDEGYFLVSLKPK